MRCGRGCVQAPQLGRAGRGGAPLAAAARPPLPSDLLQGLVARQLIASHTPHPSSSHGDDRCTVQRTRCRQLLEPPRTCSPGQPCPSAACPRSWPGSSPRPEACNRALATRRLPSPPRRRSRRRVCRRCSRHHSRAGQDQGRVSGHRHHGAGHGEEAGPAGLSRAWAGLAGLASPRNGHARPSLRRSHRPTPASPPTCPQQALNLLKAGYAVTVWNRSPDKCAALAAAGATVAPTPAAAVAACDITLAMLSDPEACLAVALGECVVRWLLDVGPGWGRRDGAAADSWRGAGCIAVCHPHHRHPTLLPTALAGPDGVASAMAPGKGYVDVSTVDAATAQQVRG